MIYPLKITNKTLVAFHKDETNIKMKSTAHEDWVSITSDVDPGQSITMTLPVKMPEIGGRYKYEFDVLNQWWLVQSGFPMYSFNINVISPLKYLGKGWNKVLNNESNNVPCVLVDFRGSRYYRCPRVVNF